MTMIFGHNNEVNYPSNDSDDLLDNTLSGPMTHESPISSIKEKPSSSLVVSHVSLDKLAIALLVGDFMFLNPLGSVATLASII